MINNQLKSLNQNNTIKKISKVPRMKSEDKNIIDSWYLNRKEVNAEMLIRYPHLIDLGYML